MTDKQVATVGRRLAKALTKFAKERGDAEKKEVAAISTELCEVCRTETEEPPSDSTPHE